MKKIKPTAKNVDLKLLGEIQSVTEFLKKAADSLEHMAELYRTGCISEESFKGAGLFLRMLITKA